MRIRALLVQTIAFLSVQIGHIRVGDADRAPERIVSLSGRVASGKSQLCDSLCKRYSATLVKTRKLIQKLKPTVPERRRDLQELSLAARKESRLATHTEFNFRLHLVINLNRMAHRPTSTRTLGPRVIVLPSSSHRRTASSCVDPRLRLRGNPRATGPACRV
jgi:hypothetical protein